MDSVLKIPNPRFITSCHGNATRDEVPAPRLKEAAGMAGGSRDTLVISPRRQATDVALTDLYSIIREKLPEARKAMDFFDI